MEHSIEFQAGRRVRHRRWMLGMPRRQLGDMIGVSIRQLEKYETGTNRISTSRMWDIAAAMKVPVSFFFEGLDGQTPDTGGARGDTLTDEEAHELVRAYYAIPEDQRRSLSDLACIVSNGGLTRARLFDTDQIDRAERDAAS